jgi:diguanylate cyclase (GGDEF)-like protein
MSQWTLAGCVLVFLCAALFYLRRSVKQRQQLRRLQEELARLREEAGQVDVDPMTGLLNRYAMARWMEQEQGFEGLVAVCDLDDFKVLNDQYGHLVGDEILHGVGKLVQASIRDEDRAFRWGGDEMVIFFRNLDTELAQARLRSLEEHLQRFQIRNHGPVAIRFSWGLAPASGRGLQESLEAADHLMYESKRTKKPSTIGNG